jgi:hypothetical protein
MTFAPLAATRCKAGRAEVLAHVVRQRHVLAEHHPASQRALCVRRAAGQRALAALAHAVERPEQPAAARAAGADLRRKQQRVRAAPALVLVARAERHQAPLDLEDRTGPDRPRPAHPRWRLDEHALAVQLRGRDPRVERARAGVLEQRHGRRDVAEHQFAAIERRQSRIGDGGAPQQGDERTEHERRLAHRDEHCRDRRGERGRRRLGEQPADERSEQHVAGVLGQRRSQPLGALAHIRPSRAASAWRAAWRRCRAPPPAPRRA